RNIASLIERRTAILVCSPTPPSSGRASSRPRRPEMAADPRVTDPALRSRKIDELYGLLAEIVAERTTAEWVELLRAADLPMTPVLSPEDLLDDEHLHALGFFQREEHPSEGEVRTIGIPVRFSRTPGDVRRLAPRLNEHREEILTEANKT